MVQRAKLHEESNSPTIRDIQIRLAKEYIKRTQKNNFEAILRLIEKKPMSKEKLQKHVRLSD